MEKTGGHFNLPLTFRSLTTLLASRSAIGIYPFVNPYRHAPVYRSKFYIDSVIPQQFVCKTTILEQVCAQVRMQ